MGVSLRTSLAKASALHVKTRGQTSLLTAAEAIDYKRGLRMGVGWVTGHAARLREWHLTLNAARAAVALRSTKFPRTAGSTA